MNTNTSITTCQSCGTSGVTKFCSNCGEELHIHRITVSHILHEVVHLLTHLDKGLLYTLKLLVLKPGFMQKEYIAGKRRLHQKPFSTFFVCGTMAALALYWINIAVANLYSSGDEHEMHFYQHYFAILQMCLVPVYALIGRWVFNINYNYAEYLVIQLYNISILFIFVILANSLKLIFGNFESGYIEIVFVLGYNIITYLNLFSTQSKVSVILKTLISSVLCFAASRVAMGVFIKYIMGHN
ncbi:MAG: DUF3667 domain-containing protein [Sphingobacteriaceae bacterium]|nr:MAG: DUF3667 domain-containing protein [Sphingobacteriaceae bacterium]